MKYFELQPLRIPSGWTVKYNNFSEYDLQTHGTEYAYELNEDLLQLEYCNVLIDLGWYPSMDINGRYVMYFVNTNNKNYFDNPIDVFESKSKKEIILKLEYWISEGHYRQYICQENNLQK